MTRPLIVVDVETNGLDPEAHHVWEFSWWNLTTGERDTFLPYIGDGRDFLHAANRTALRVNRFIDRWTDERLAAEDYGVETARGHLTLFLDNVWPKQDDDESRAVMVCAQPKFDLPFISKTLSSHDVTAVWAKEPQDRVEPWFYRAIDISSWGGAMLGLDPRAPLSASGLARRLGVEIPPEQRHTAEGDVTLVGRTMLLLEYIRDLAGPESPESLERVLRDAPSGDEIDALIG